AGAAPRIEQEEREAEGGDAASDPCRRTSHRSFLTAAAENRSVGAALVPARRRAAVLTAGSGRWACPRRLRAGRRTPNRRPPARPSGGRRACRRRDAP